MGPNLIKYFLLTSRVLLLAGGLQMLLVGAPDAQAVSGPLLGTFGTPALIDMPTAQVVPDSQISVTVSHIRGISRTSIGFQLTPRINATIRYSAHGKPAFNYDRSLDLSYLIAREHGYLPALSVGLRDVLGTGWYSGEYLVATKSLGARVTVTGGIGWGRLGSYGSFRNPLSGVLGSGFDTRPTTTLGMGGIPAYDRWFRGPAALFGGITWKTPIRGLTFAAEYSSDAYTREVTAGILTHRSPINLSLTYRFRNGATVAGYVLHGSRIGIMGSVALNPRLPANASSIGPAPQPVFRRVDAPPYDTSWTAQGDAAPILRKNLALLLRQDGLTFEALNVGATDATLWFRNTGFGAVPEAIGRVARAMSRALPSSVERFTIVPVARGIPVLSVTLARHDIETLEHDPDASAKIYRKAQISDAAPRIPRAARLGHSSFLRSWSLGPYGDLSLFDPTNPVRLDVGLRLKGQYELMPGLILSGGFRKKLFGNRNTVTRLSTSVMPHVRSDSGFYDRQGDPALEYLTGEYFFRPGHNLYGRITVGYLEEMYGGLSSELLWKPVSSKLAFGVEVNAVRQRAFNQLLGFRPYSIVTARASAYWDMGNGFFGQVDVGRYLAGDYGATFTLDRVFDNGWKIGAYFTLTNVSAATFGEGSFDKGLRFTMPLNWLSGKPSTRKFSHTLQPLTRDGGARLDVRNRLYGLVEDYQGDRLKRRWGRFWR